MEFSLPFQSCISPLTLRMCLKSLVGGPTHPALAASISRGMINKVTKSTDSLRESQSIYPTWYTLPNFQFPHHRYCNCPKQDRLDLNFKLGRLLIVCAVAIFTVTNGGCQPTRANKTREMLSYRVLVSVNVQ